MEFTKKDLKTGMKVVYRNKHIRYVVLNTKNGDQLVDELGYPTMYLANFRNDLSSIGSSGSDIMEVYEGNEITMLGMGSNEDKINCPRIQTLVWKRTKPKVIKEMTLTQIAKMAGCDEVKIIKE
jgi:hypothetical protein